MNRIIALVVVKAALGTGLALGFAAAPRGTAHAEPSPVIEEDSPQWDCRYDGNRICGVGATLSDGSLAIPGDYSKMTTAGPGAIYCPPADDTVTDRNGVPVGPLAYDVGAYVGGYN